VRDYGVESSMRLDVYRAKVAAKENLEKSGEWVKLSAEQQRLVDKMVGWTQLVVSRGNASLDSRWHSCWSGPQ